VFGNLAIIQRRKINRLCHRRLPNHSAGIKLDYSAESLSASPQNLVQAGSTNQADWPRSEILVVDIAIANLEGKDAHQISRHAIQ